jgi:hypothetical protein
MRFLKSPNFALTLAGMLGSMGVTSLTRTDSDGQAARIDANEVAFTVRGLEFVFQETYDVEYPELKAKSLLPLNTRVPTGANTYTYFQWDRTGECKFITNYANDFSQAEVQLKEFTGKVAALGNGFSYSVQDLRAAQSVQFGVGAPLDSLRAQAARDVHEQKVDDVAAYGNAARGLNGFINHPDIPTITVSAGGGAWSTALATVSEANNLIIIADLNKLCNSIEQSTLGLYKPDTLILPLSVKPRLTSPMTPGTFNAGSLLGQWLKQQEMIKNVEFWSKLDAAQSAGALAAGSAWAMAYYRSNKVVELVIPQPFEMFEPERDGMTFKVACHSRIGGVTIRYPLALAKMNVGT